MTQKTSQARNAYIDYLKGLLVLLVTYGHTIQYIGYRNNTAEFFDDPIFKLIYIFHMPLFMATSGFVSFYSIEKSAAFETISKRFRQLIVPIVSWAIISKTALAFSQLNLKDPNLFALLLLLVKAIVHETLDSFWFLWCVFGATIVISILKQLKFNSALSFTVVSLLLLCLPEFGNLYFSNTCFRSSVRGYLAAKNSSAYSQLKDRFLQSCFGLNSVTDMLSTLE